MQKLRTLLILTLALLPLTATAERFVQKGKTLVLYDGERAAAQIECQGDLPTWFFFPKELAYHGLVQAQNDDFSMALFTLNRVEVHPLSVTKNEEITHDLFRSNVTITIFKNRSGTKEQIVLDSQTFNELWRTVADCTWPLSPNRRK